MNQLHEIIIWFGCGKCLLPSPCFELGLPVSISFLFLKHLLLSFLFSLLISWCDIAFFLEWREGVKSFHALSSIFLSSDYFPALIWSPPGLGLPSSQPRATRHSSLEWQESVAPPHRCRSDISCAKVYSVPQQVWVKVGQGHALLSLLSTDLLHNSWIAEGIWLP